jgi:hypothetical protein
MHPAKPRHPAVGGILQPKDNVLELSNRLIAEPVAQSIGALGAQIRPYHNGGETPGESRHYKANHGCERSATPQAAAGDLGAGHHVYNSWQSVSV